MSHQDDLPSIEADELDTVTGGVSSTTKDSNSQVSAALQAISSSLADLKSNGGNNSNNSMQSLLPMLMLFGGKGGAGGACPCGCGMANCRR